MKKLLFILSIVATLGPFNRPVKAQSQLDFGIHGGANFARINNVDFNIDNISGFMLGLYLKAPIYKKFLQIQPEFLYIQKGFKFPGSTSQSITYRINYMEIPVLLRINFLNPTQIIPFIYGGPYFGFNIGTNFPQVAADGSGFIDSQIKTKDIGITVGGGLKIGHVNIGIRYDDGLTHVIEHTDITNGVFSILAGLSL